MSLTPTRTITLTKAKRKSLLKRGRHDVLDFVTQLKRKSKQSRLNQQQPQQQTQQTHNQPQQQTQQHDHPPSYHSISCQCRQHTTQQTPINYSAFNNNDQVPNQAESIHNHQQEQMEEIGGIDTMIDDNEVLSLDFLEALQDGLLKKARNSLMEDDKPLFKGANHTFTDMTLTLAKYFAETKSSKANMNSLIQIINTVFEPILNKKIPKLKTILDKIQNVKKDYQQVHYCPVHEEVIPQGGECSVCKGKIGKSTPYYWHKSFKSCVSELVEMTGFAKLKSALKRPPFLPPPLQSSSSHTSSFASLSSPTSQQVFHSSSSSSSSSNSSSNNNSNNINNSSYSSSYNGGRRTTTTTTNPTPQTIADCCDATEYERITGNGWWDDKALCLTLSAGTDGACATKSTNKSINPLLAWINELPLESRFSYPVSFLLAYANHSIPYKVLLHNFINEMILLDKGVEVNDPNTPNSSFILKVRLFNMILDLVSIQELLNISGHAGCNGCRFCNLLGCKEKDTGVIYSTMSGNYGGQSFTRNWEQMKPNFIKLHKKEISSFDGVSGVSILLKLPYFRWTTQVSCDILHNLLEGLCKKVLNRIVVLYDRHVPDLNSKFHHLEIGMNHRNLKRKPCFHKHSFHVS